MTPLSFTPRARADLLDAWIYIGADNPPAADRMIDSIHRRLCLLAEHPYSGVPRDDIAQTSVTWLPAIMSPCTA